MPVILCPESIPCIDPSTPVTNFSTEAPDPNEFLSLQWPVVNPNNPVGGDMTVNKMPNQWNADGCLSECESTISQQDADECAARQAALCLNQNAGNSTFTNDAQSCSVTCPTGSLFTVVVPGGTVAASTKAAANAQAAALACELVAIEIQCPTCNCDFTPATLPSGTQGIAYSAQFTPTNQCVLSPFSWQVTSGSLPPGLTLNEETGLLSGTPTQPGTFSFTIELQSNAT